MKRNSKGQSKHKSKSKSKKQKREQLVVPSSDSPKRTEDYEILPPEEATDVRKHILSFLDANDYQPRSLYMKEYLLSEKKFPRVDLFPSILIKEQSRRLTEPVLTTAHKNVTVTMYQKCLKEFLTHLKKDRSDKERRTLNLTVKLSDTETLPTKIPLTDDWRISFTDDIKTESLALEWLVANISKLDNGSNNVKIVVPMVIDVCVDVTNGGEKTVYLVDKGDLLRAHTDYFFKHVHFDIRFQLAGTLEYEESDNVSFVRSVLQRAVRFTVAPETAAIMKVFVDHHLVGIPWHQLSQFSIEMPLLDTKKDVKLVARSFHKLDTLSEIQLTRSGIIRVLCAEFGSRTKGLSSVLNSFKKHRVEFYHKSDQITFKIVERIMQCSSVIRLEFGISMNIDENDAYEIVYEETNALESSMEDHGFSVESKIEESASLYFLFQYIIVREDS